MKGCFFIEVQFGFIRNLITEGDLFISFLISVLKLTLEIIVVVGIFTVLSYVDLYFTILITTVFLFFAILAGHPKAELLFPRGE